jgi:uncharacterized protein (TIGR03435 family)
VASTSTWPRRYNLTMVRIVSAANVLVMVATSVWGQHQPAFEVASIRAAGSGRSQVMMDGARAEFSGASLASLISRAYGVRSFQISGPDWMNTARFDILAKLPEGASSDQVPAMLQTLLAGRFRLALHREPKEFPVYTLVAGKDGPKLTPCPADFDKREFSCMDPEKFADLFFAGMDRPVVDQTELEDPFMVPMSEIQQAVTRQRMALLAARGFPLRTAAAGGAAEPDGNSVFHVVRGCGLELEAKQLALPLLVIDHLEKLPRKTD